MTKTFIHYKIFSYRAIHLIKDTKTKEKTGHIHRLINNLTRTDEESVSCYVLETPDFQHNPNHIRRRKTRGKARRVPIKYSHNGHGHGHRDRVGNIN